MDSSDDDVDLRHVVQYTAFLDNSILQTRCSPEDLDVILSAARLPPFFQRFWRELMRRRANEEARVAHREALAGLETARAQTEALIKGDRTNPCFLFWLPLTLRARVWELLFWPSDDRWVVAPKAIIPGATILRTSKLLNFETSIALSLALVSCQVMLMFYPDHCFLRQSFPLFADLGDRVYPQLTLPLGDSRQDPHKGMGRSLDFIRFIKALRDTHPLLVYELSIFIHKSWKLPHISFDEDDLAQLLVSGAFAFFKVITISGCCRRG